MCCARRPWLLAALLVAMPCGLLDCQEPERAVPDIGLAGARLDAVSVESATLMGLHLSASRPFRVGDGGSAVVAGVTADMFYRGGTRSCVLAPPDTTCLPSAPNLRALTVGWSSRLGQSLASIYLALGHFSGRRRSGGGGMVRLDIASRGAGHAGSVLFGQYQLVPGFGGGRLQMLLGGLALRLR